MKIRVLFGCVVCLVSFAAESQAWIWPFSKSKDNEKVKVDGRWSPWRPWSSCLQEETPPYRYKERTCTNPAPQNGGATCNGVARKTRACENCTRPLGLENGKIKDLQISSPSFHNEFPARNARLNGNSGWCADIQDDDIYLEVDLQNLTTISAIATQGFYPDPQTMSLRRGRVSKYELMYSQDGLGWERYGSSSGASQLPGNREKVGTVTNVLTPEINARYLRIYPLSFFSFICMRVELYGCQISCGGRLDENPGNLEAKSSEDEEKDCLWLVDLPNVRKVHFDFVNFAVPCRNGEVVIKDGSVPYELAPVLGQYCGFDQNPPPVVGNKGKLWVRFTSNASDPQVGFYANYFPGCGGHLQADDGTLESPNYPNRYFHNSKCTWTITVPEGKRIHLKFQHFDVDGDRDRHRCPTDHVTIWDGVNLGVPLVGRFCNSNLPPLICSTNNTLKLKFRADDVIARTGFLATFYAVKADTVCSTSSSLPTMAWTPSLSSLPSSYAATLPSTSILYLTKTAVYSSMPSAFALPTNVPSALTQRNRTNSTRAYIQSSLPEAAKAPYTIPVLSGSGNVSGNSSHSDNPDLLARNDDDDEDDDKDDLITIIIISAFGFMVLCLIAASILPGIKRHCEKKKEKESSSVGAEIGATDNHNLSGHGDFYPENFQEADESSVFLPVKAGSVSLSEGSTEELPPEYEADSLIASEEQSKNTDLQEENASVQSEVNGCVPLHSQEALPESQVEDMPEESDFHISCQDLSASFALEMQAMMSKFTEDTDAGLELTNAQNASPPKNSTNSLQGSDSQHESTENCTTEENPQTPTKPAEGNTQYPEGCGNENDHGTPCAEVPTPWHLQPDRNPSRTRGMKSKGKMSSGSFAESKDSGCASSVENVHDTETCV